MIGLIWGAPWENLPPVHYANSEVLISLRIPTGWSGPLLFAYGMIVHGIILRVCLYYQRPLSDCTALLVYLDLPSGHMTFIQRRINVDATSWRCIDVNATLYKRHVHAWFTVCIWLEDTVSQFYHTIILYKLRREFVCVKVLRLSQPKGVKSSAVSLSNHFFIGQA